MANQNMQEPNKDRNQSQGGKEKKSTSTSGTQTGRESQKSGQHQKGEVVV